MSKTEGLQTSALGVTADILDKTAFASIQSKFRNEQPAFFKLYKALRKDSTSDLISVEEFSRIYKSLWIHLDRLELSYITETFSSGIEGQLNLTKFVNRLNILPPSDYSEPDRHLDPLPEPLAGIVEILELEILDRAWLDIIQLHPEIPIDEEGNSLVVRRNRNLEVLCAPSATARQSVLPTSTASNGDSLFAAYEDGSVVVFSSRSGDEKHSVPVFRQLVRSRNQPSSIILLSNAVSVPSANGVPVSRVAVCVLYEVARPAEEVEPAAPAKKPAKGKGAVVEETPKPPEREFMLHAKIVETVESESGSRSIGIKVLTEELQCTVSSLAVSVDLCCDGNMFTICHTDRCNVYHMSEAAQGDVLAGGHGLAQVPEEKPSSLCDDSPSFELVLLSVVSMAAYESGRATAPTEGGAELLGADLNRVGFQKCYSILLSDILLPKAPKGPPTGEPVRETTDPSVVMKKYGLIIVSDSSPSLLIAGFSPPVAAAPSAPAVPDKKGAPPPDPAPVAPQGLLDTFLMHRWQLTGPVAASLLDSSRQLLALGTTDGTVSLWDIPNRSLLSVCGRHGSPVTALSFAEGVSSHVLSSGAADGTVCFYAMRRGGGVEGAQGPGTFEAATRLIDVRQDVPKAAVCSLFALAQTSIVICVFSDGTVAAYEAESADLMGRLVLYVGMMAQKMDSRPVPVFDVLRTARAKHLQWLANSLPSIDDGDTSDAGTFVPAATGDDSPAAAALDIVDPVEEFYGPARSLVLAGADLHGLCVIFSDVAKESESTEVDFVRASFTTNTVIESLCPGIAALVKGNAGPQASAPLPSATDLYRTLSIDERKNPHVSRASIQFVNPTPGTASTVADSETKKVRGKKTPALTAANLNAHDNNDLIFKAPAPKLGSLHGTTVWTRGSLGASLLKDLRQRPDAQKQNKRVANRIKQLSSILPSS